MENPLDALRNALEEKDIPAAKVALESVRRTSAAVTQVAAEVLHELKQPLLGVKAYAQMLGEEGAPRGHVQALMAQVERMEQIITDFTRIASDKAAPKQRINLSYHVFQAEHLFKLNPESARITLEVDAPPEVLIEGNGRLMEQLTLNLLNNARDAMGGLGRIKVVVSVEGSAPTLMVADWGPGIPMEMRERIFQPYVTTKKRGSGLGLAVCQRIAREHNARIDLVPPTTMRELHPPATVFKVSFGAETTAAVPLRGRLLVVDDESIIRMVFRDLMGKECEVVTAQTAEEALEHLRSGPFDLIVTDKNLPDLSGLDLAQEARRLNPDSRVILMTGYPSLVTAQQALELGVMDYLLKPFDEIREVRSKIRAALTSPPPGRFQANNKRVDVYEDNPESARRISDALALLGMQANVLTEPKIGGEDPPAGLVMSWDFSAAHGKKSVELARDVRRGAPFVVLAEHLTMETTLECLRGGAVACLPKLQTEDPQVLSRELARALRLV
ncbi:MAG TPA: hybrid histidine protein kinase/response regulator SinK [Myxococcaceae bacterium]|nr:hybrid histidine protein kinase/response regulator SinK [Myxococcaceae bacterium]